MKRLPAFSLVEIAIGLFIVGLLLTAVMKGSRLIDSAKTQTCVQQIMEIKRDFDMWLDNQSSNGLINPNLFSLPKDRPKLGGVFHIEAQRDGKYSLFLQNSGGNGFLSPAQIQELQRYLPEATALGCDMNGSSKTCRFSIPLN